MKTGDYVLIPGANCDRIAFGKITSDAYIYEPTEQDKLDAMFGEPEITFLKRRNVEWITETPFNRAELDPMLIPIIYSYGTIVDANPYSAFINRTIYNIYFRGNTLHAIFNIARADNIPAYEFNQFISNIFRQWTLIPKYPDLILTNRRFPSKPPLTLRVLLKFLPIQLPCLSFYRLYLYL